MTELWFTSDLHLGHKFVSDLRGFANTEAHDGMLATQWDFRVNKNDLVWVLGDLTLGSFSAACDWIDQRPGRKRLVLGNHDAPFPGHRDAHKHFARLYQSFETVGSMARIRVIGREVLLSHFPYPGTSEGTDENGRPFDDRYRQYRLHDLGVPLIHGHTHRNERLTTSQLGTAQIHIGLDAWDFRPVRLREIESLMMQSYDKAAKA